MGVGVDRAIRSQKFLKSWRKRNHKRVEKLKKEGRYAVGEI